MSATVEVRALHCGAGSLPNKLLFSNTTPENENDLIQLPIWAFYIHHPVKNIRALWDLGILKDNSMHPPVQQWFVENILKPVVPEDAAEVLTRNGVSPSEINYLFMSHAHLDHVGEPSKFPNATIVFGQGTQEHCRPAYPVNPDSKYLESTFPENRTRELEDKDFTMAFGEWPRACDFFGDGSVVLVDAQGHMPGHMVAVVKTETGRLLLGGDSCHHCRHLGSFGKGGVMGYGMHLDEEKTRLNLERIDRFLKGNGDVKLCLAHVGEHGDFEKL